MLNIEKFLISPLWMIVALFGFVFLGWLLLVRIYPQTDDFWHKTDLWWLILSAIGIFGLFPDSRKFIAEREYTKIEYFRLGGMQWQFNSELNPNRFKRHFVRGRFSPDYLPDLQEDYDNIYRWVIDNRDTIFRKYTDRIYIDTNDLNFPHLKSRDDILPGEKDRIVKLINDYNKLLEEREDLKKKMDPTNLEIIFMFFSPFFIVIGLSFRFTRYLGERRNMK